MPFQQCPVPYMRLPITVAAPMIPFISNGPKMTCTCKGNSCSGVSFFKLGEPFLIRQVTEFLPCSARQKADSGLGQNHHVSCHPSTGCHTTRDNLLLGLRDPRTHAKPTHHVVLVMKHCQVIFGFVAKGDMILQPFDQSTDIAHCMIVGHPITPVENLLCGVASISPILPSLGSGCDQLRLADSYHSLVCQAGHTGTAGRTAPIFLLAQQTRCTVKGFSNW